MDITIKANITDVIIVDRDVIQRSKNSEILEITPKLRITHYKFSALYWDIYRPYYKYILSKTNQKINIVFFTKVEYYDNLLGDSIRESIKEHFKIKPNITIVLVDNHFKFNQLLIEVYKLSDNNYSIGFYNNNDRSENTITEPSVISYLTNTINKKNTIIDGDKVCSILSFEKFTEDCTCLDDLPF